MGKCHPIELRERAVAIVESGLTHRAAAAQLCVSIKFVNDMVRLKRETGTLQPRKQGHSKTGKLAAVTPWIERRVKSKGEITLDQLVDELLKHHGLSVHRSSVWTTLRRLGLSHKKTLHALWTCHGIVPLR